MSHLEIYWNERGGTRWGGIIQGYIQRDIVRLYRVLVKETGIGDIVRE